MAFVTLGNILDKINLLSLHNKSPITFSIEEVEKGQLLRLFTLHHANMP